MFSLSNCVDLHRVHVICIHVLLVVSYFIKEKYQLLESMFYRVVNGLAPFQVHGGPGPGTVKEKVEPDFDPEPFQNEFFSFRTRTRTIHGTNLDQVRHGI